MSHYLKSIFLQHGGHTPELPQGASASLFTQLSHVRDIMKRNHMHRDVFFLFFVFLLVFIKAVIRLTMYSWWVFSETTPLVAEKSKFAKLVLADK